MQPALFKFLLLLAVAAPISRAATIEESFELNPLAPGWSVFGDGSLFRWSETNQNLEATWDSSRPNSYFYRPLNTLLTKSDDFTLAFDLRLNDIAVGVSSNKTATFEIAIGLLRLADATRTNFLRGVGIHPLGPRNLVEFDYFPDSGFGATISPTMVSSNNQFALGFNFPLALTPGDIFRIAMSYTASNQTLGTVVTRNGAAFGPINDVRLTPSFSDFRVDTVAICNYSDTGADGSVLAHGSVDNLIVTLPDPPIRSLTGSFTNGLWRVEFVGATNWWYTLERTEDFQSWNEVSPGIAGLNGPLILTDTNAPAGKAFYQVRAERP